MPVLLSGTAFFRQLAIDFHVPAETKEPSTNPAALNLVVTLLQLFDRNNTKFASHSLIDDGPSSGDQRQL